MLSDFTMKRNLAKFVLQYLEDGILEFQRRKSTYLRGCIIFSSAILPLLHYHSINVCGVDTPIMCCLDRLANQETFF